MKKTASLTLRLTEELVDFLNATAARTGMAPSAIVRLAVEDFRQRVLENGVIVLSLHPKTGRDIVNNPEKMAEVFPEKPKPASPKSKNAPVANLPKETKRKKKADTSGSITNDKSNYGIQELGRDGDTQFTPIPPAKSRAPKQKKAGR